MPGRGPLQQIKSYVGHPGIQDDLQSPCCGVGQEGPSQSRLVQKGRFFQGMKSQSDVSEKAETKFVHPVSGPASNPGSLSHR